jgi:transcription initiation factor TFIID subunit 6
MDTSAPTPAKPSENAAPAPSGRLEVKGEANGKTIGTKRGRSRGESLEDDRKVLANAWKEDGDTWRLFGKLVDLFGDGMLPFIPRPELTLLHN